MLEARSGASGVVVSRVRGEPRGYVGISGACIRCCDVHNMCLRRGLRSARRTSEARVKGRQPTMFAGVGVR